jgi:CBS domain-containing protein
LKADDHKYEIKKIRDLMTQTQPISIDNTKNVRDAKNLMKTARKNIIFVKDPTDPTDNKYEKILRVSDLIGKDDGPISSFLNSLQDVTVITENEEISEVLSRLCGQPITLVKNSENKIVGVISSTDKERYLDTL